MTFVSAMLPHAPRLEDLTASTPALLRWASLVAHVATSNIDLEPSNVRSIESIKSLLDILHDTRDVVEQERVLAEVEWLELEEGGDR